jgi:hypothetical protein
MILTAGNGSGVIRFTRGAVGERPSVDCRQLSKKGGKVIFTRQQGWKLCANCGCDKTKHVGNSLLGSGKKCTTQNCPCVFFREK